jgi:hypothetical protein
MSASEKDWNERFQRAQAKPRVGRVVVGIGIIVVRVFTLAYGIPEIYLETFANRLGALLGDMILFALAIWLIYTGRRPAKVNIPKD